MTVCKVDDCGNPVVSKMLCTKHYKRVRRNGTTEKSQLIVEEILCRICDKRSVKVSVYANSRSLARNKPTCDVCITLLRRLKRYNLSIETFKSLSVSSNGKCMSCFSDTEDLVIDHDHACCNGPYSCGKCVRGLLCNKCNLLIGHIEANIERLEQAKQYLLTRQ